MQLDLDRALLKAVESAVERRLESPELARRILLWLEALHMGSENLSDREAIIRRIEVLLESVKDI